MHAIYLVYKLVQVNCFRVKNVCHLMQNEKKIQPRNFYKLWYICCRDYCSSGRQVLMERKMGIIKGAHERSSLINNNIIVACRFISGATR